MIVVVDASNLQRNLYLVSQLIELGRPLVVALNMMDIAQRRGLKVSPENLQKSLGVPIVPVVGSKRIGDCRAEGGGAEGDRRPAPEFYLARSDDPGTATGRRRLSRPRQRWRRHRPVFFQGIGRPATGADNSSPSRQSAT